MLALSVIGIGSLHAQLTGLKMIPGDYPSLGAAITDLNTQGVGPGGVVFNLLAGNPQTAPAGGYVITASGTATDQIIFLGNSNVITAAAPQVAGQLNDAIFKLVGADYVTLGQFAMIENPANTITAAATNDMTEWAVALLYASATDGAKNCSILANSISLVRTYQNSFGIYSTNRHNATTIGTANDITSPTGANDNLTIQGNTISNVNIGICVIGSTTGANMINGLLIGGPNPGDGNIISNYGSTNVFSTYISVSGTVNGIVINNVLNANIQGNTITSSAGGTTAGTLRGIFIQATGTLPTTGTFTNTVNGNTISLHTGVATGDMFGIRNEAGNANVSFVIVNNNFSNFVSSSSGAVTFISNTGAGQNQTISNNTFTNLSLANTGSVTFIGASTTLPANGTQTVTGNSIVTGFTKTAAGGTVTLFTSSASSPGTAVITHAANNFSNISVTGATTIAGWVNTDGSTAPHPQKTFTGNQFSNWTGGTNAVTAMNISYLGTNSSVSGNTITNITGQGAITGLSIGSSGSATAATVNGNVINTLTSSGTGGTVTGLTSANPATINYSGNMVNTLSSTATTVNGIVVSGGGTVHINANKVYDLSSSNAAGVVTGLITSGGTTVNVYNNLIGDLRAPASSGANMVIGLNITGGTTVNAHYNTIYLSATSSGINFGTTGIGASTTPTVVLRNNLVVNLSTAAGTGLVAAYRRSGTTLTSYSTASNNNSFYAGTPSATNVIYTDGTNIDQTLTAFKTRMATRDALSVSVNPTFSSTTGSSPSFLHIPAATTTLLESGGVVVTGFTADYDNDARPGPVGSVNGGGLAPDIGADEFDGIVAGCTGTPATGTPTISAAVCGSGTFVLSSPSAPTDPGITYQWQESAASGGPYTNIAGATTITYTTSTVTTTTYYVLIVTCTNSGISSVSPEVTGTVYPAASVSVTPTSGAICSPGGTPIALSASGASTYAWLPAAGLSATTGANVNALPASTTTYTVTGTDANGCTATATTSLTVTENPSIVAVSATPSSVCSGGNSQLQVTAGTTTSYTVTAITHAPVPTPGVGVTTLASGGTATTALSAGSLDDGGWASQTIPFPFTYFGVSYTSFAVSTNGFAYLGTGAPNTYTGYYNTFPSTAAARPSIGGIYSDLDFRTTGTINYFITGTAPNRALVINWSGGQFYSGTGSLNTQVILYESSNIIEVHTTSSTGTNAATQGIQNAAGTQAFTVPGRNNANWAVATPGAYRFAPNGGTLTYSWTPAAFLSSTTVNNPMATGVTSTTTYSVTVTNGACSQTGSVTVTAGSALTASGSITPSSTVCQGANVTLNSVPVGGGAPYTYAWSGPNSFASTAQNPALAGVTPAMAGIYTVVITDNCAATQTVTLTLNVNAAPSVAVTSSSSLYCSGTAALSLTASGSSSTYAWSPSAGLSATTGSSVNASPASTTTYTVIGTDGNGCTNSTTTTITASETPSMTSLVAAPAAICSADTATLTAAAGLTSAYTVNTTAFAPQTCLANAGPTGDDNVQAANAIGFSFNYFGTTYTSFGISTNGNIQLGDGSGNASNPSYSTAWTDAVNPTAGVPNNLVALCWDDWFISAGQITWGTTGTAPNRKLVVCYNTTGRGGGNPDTLIGQIVLEETTNAIYMHITKKGVSTNSATQGIENQNGTVGVPVTGRQNQAWSATNSSRVFMPSGGTMTYAWSPSSFLSSTTGASVDANGATATTTYSVTATSAAGCTTTGSVTLTVNPLPTVSASVTDAAICAGDAVTFTGSGASSYVWTGGVTDAVAYTPAATGSYTVTGTDGNGCTDTDVITVTVNALPTVVANTTATAVCDGSQVTLSGSGATSYTWTGSVTDAVPFTPATTDTYTVTGTDANGCTNTDAVTVTVNTLPTVVANTTATAVCDGSPVTLSGSGADTYTWTGSVTDAVPFTPAATDTYTVTGTDVNGCTDTDVVTVTVNTLPAVVANTTAAAVCDGDQVTLSGSGADTYTWTGSVTDAVPFTPAATDTYTVTGTDVNGCTDTDVITVTVNALPTVTASATDTVICAGDSVMVMGGGAAMYSWTGGVMDATNFAPAATDTYTVTGTDVNGCMNTASVMITVNAGPMVTLSLPLDTVCMNMGVIALTGETPVGGMWSGSGVTGSTFDPAAAGVGPVTITYMYTDSVTGCSSTTTDMWMVDICNSIEVNAGVTVELYPNPNNGEFNLIPSGSGLVDVLIYNAAGQLISAEKANCGQINPIRIDASGMYTIAIVTADGQRTMQRVIVNR